MEIKNKEVIEMINGINRYAELEAESHKSYTDIIANFIILKNHQNLKAAYDVYTQALNKLEREYNIKSDNGQLMDMRIDDDLDFNTRAKLFLAGINTLLEIINDINIIKIKTSNFKNDPPAAALIYLSFMIEEGEDEDEA